MSFIRSEQKLLRPTQSDLNIIRSIYQKEIIDNLRESFRKGYKQTLVQSHPGSGKSYVFRDLAIAAATKGKSIFYCAPRINLVLDIFKKLQETGLWAGFIMSGCKRDHFAKVQLCCLPSLLKLVQTAQTKPHIDVLVIDEAHVEQDSVAELVSHYPNAVVITMTGTPLPGMDRYVQDVVKGPSMEFLTKHGLLAPIKYVSLPSKERPPELSGKKAKDLIGDPVKAWIKYGEGLPTVVFAQSVAKAKKLTEMFRARGIPWEYMIAETETEGEGGRKDLFQKLKDGRIKGLSTVGTVSYGVDIPELACAILAYTVEQDVERTPEKIADYRQKVSRIIRTHENKKYAIVIDHCGVVDEFGDILCESEWPIESVGGKERLAEEIGKVAEKSKQVTCKACGAQFSNEYTDCPNCHEPVKTRKAKELKFIDVELKVVRPEGKAKAHAPTQSELRTYFEACKVIQKREGYKEGYAFALFKDSYPGYNPPKITVVSGGDIPQNVQQAAEDARKRKIRAYFAKQRGIERAQRAAKARAS